MTYFLKLSKVINVITSPGFSSPTDAIGPFGSVDEAHAWFVHHAKWLDDRGVDHVSTEFMCRPLYQEPVT